MSARCPICYKEMHIIEDNLYEGMGPQGIPVLRTIYIPKCLSCGYSLDMCTSKESALLRINRWTSLDFRNIWRVEDELELYPSLSEAIDRAKEILKKKNIMKILFYKIRAKYRTENVENDVVEGYEVYFTRVDDEDIVACFFSSEIYGTEEAYKKASEAKEELSRWQYERR